MATTSLEAIRRITIEAQAKGLDEVAAKLDKVAKAQEGVVASSTNVEKSSGSVEQAFRREQRGLDANVGAYEKYARSVKAVSDAQAQGLTSNQRATELLALAEARLRKATGATEDFGKAAGPARHEWVNLSRQLQDVGVSLQGGMSPLTVLAQQGSQISDVFISSRASVGDFAKSAITGAAGFLSAWGPAIAGVTLAVGGLALAMQKANEQRENLIATSSGKGRGLGLGPQDVDTSASRSRAPGVSQGESREGILEFVRAGGPSVAIMEQFNALAKQYATTLNTELLPAQKELAQIAADPAKGIAIVEEKLTGALIPAIKDEIRQLQANGQIEAAGILLKQQMTEALISQTNAATTNAQAWALIKTGLTVAGGSVAEFTTSLVTLNGIIPQFIVSTANIFTGFSTHVPILANYVTTLLGLPPAFNTVAAAAQAAAPAVGMMTEVTLLAADSADKLNKASTLRIASMNAATVEDKAAAASAEALNAAQDKQTNSFLANTEARIKANEVRAQASAQTQQTIRNQEIEIATNNKLVAAYQLQVGNIAELVARIKEEQAIRQAGLNVLDADSQKRIENAGTIARQTAELEKAKEAAKEYANEATRRAAMSGDERLAEDRKRLDSDGGGGRQQAAGSVDFKGYDAQGGAILHGSQSDVAAAHRQLAAAANDNTQAFGANTQAAGNMTTTYNQAAAAGEAWEMAVSSGTDATSMYNDRVQKLERDLDSTAQAARDWQSLQGRSAQEASAGVIGLGNAARSAAGSVATLGDAASTSFAAGGDKPLSQRGGFTSTRRLTFEEWQTRDAGQQDKAAEVQKQIAETQKAGQQRQLQYASSTIQEQIQALQDQKTATQENTDALEKETQKRREQLDKQVAKLEKALNPSRPDPYAERNPDYFYRFGTQAFKENDPLQALLAAAEGERDALDTQLEQQKKSAELQQKAIDEQIKGYEAQIKELNRAGNLLSAGVDLSAQEVAGIKNILGAIQGLGDYGRLQAANMGQTQTAMESAAKAGGDPAGEFAGTIEYGTERMTRGAAYTPAYGFQKGIGGFSGFFASGGYIPPGSWGVAGESGPEIINRKRAVAGPATVTPIGGGSRPIVVNQTIVSQGGVRELRASRGEIAQRSSSEMRRSLGAR